MKTLFKILILFYSFNLNAQDLIFGGGIIINSYYSFTGNDEGYLYSEYKPGEGYSAFIGYEGVAIDSTPFDLIISFNNYKGHIYTSNGGHVGSRWTNLEAEISRIGLTFIPLRFNIGQNLKIKSGIDMSWLVFNHFKGTQGYYFLASGDIDTLNGPQKEIVNKFSVGMTIKIQYEISLSENLYLVPQYMINLGLSNEFRNIEVNTKSFKQFFAVGLMKKLIH